MFKSQFLFFCVFVLFCGLAFIGKRVFSENENNKQSITATDSSQKHGEEDVLPHGTKDNRIYIMVTNFDGANELVRLQDGLDLSGKDLRHAVLTYGDTGSPLVWRDIDFSGCNLLQADMREAEFVNCSFNNAKLYGVQASASKFIDCDFTNAFIGAGNGHINGGEIFLSKEELLSTASYKDKEITRFFFRKMNLSGVDFSGFNLEGCTFMTNNDGCDFSDAVIINTSWCGISTEHPTRPDTRWGVNNLSREQLASTASFKNGDLRGVAFAAFDFSGMDLSNMDMSGSSFWQTTGGWPYPYIDPDLTQYCNFQNVNFTDSIISRCQFVGTESLTLEQIQSTWNYKAGRMAGITLPEEIQQALDAEKERK